MIELCDIAVECGSFRLQGANLEVAPGEYATLMGNSGSGKTTILEILLGLRVASRGRVRIGGEDMTLSPPADRGIGYVPQDAALFPHMTVAQHLAFGPSLRRWPAARIAARIEELGGQLRLEPLLGRRPAGLSGGERQRVALGRALSWKPRALCLDEPFSSLDDASRQEMMEVLTIAHREERFTALHVTHHRGEAEFLCQRLFLLEDGRIHEQR
jgi:ABC-type sugar transport system ATPase subunit